MSTPVPPLVPTASMPLATDSDAQFDAKAFPALASLNPFGVSLEAIAASAVSNADAALAAAIGGDLPPLTGEALKFLRVNAGETSAEFAAIPTQATAVWESGTDTNESLVSAAKVAAAIAALAPETGGFLQSLGSTDSTGYTQFPNGLILQWGRVSVGSASSTIFTLPLAFTTAHIGGLTTVNRTGILSGAQVGYYDTTSLTQGRVVNDNSTTSSTQSYYWLAIGH